MFIIKHRKFFLSLSLILVLAALLSLYTFGLNPGTDFKGGTIYEVEYTTARPDVNNLRQAVEKLNVGAVTMQAVGDKGVVIKMATIDQATKQKIANALDGGDPKQIVEKRFDAIGPSLGQELARRGVLAIILVIVVIVLFVTFAFRKVAAGVGNVRSWKYGVVTIVALLHDVILPTGVAAYLASRGQFEADALFLTALLTIMALSVNDTIVIFDRIRENVKNHISASFEETVGKSLDQTILRSLITSLTVIITLLVLYFVGAESTRNFALIMAIGMFFGTYSSIFVASPLLVVWERWSSKK